MSAILDRDEVMLTSNVSLVLIYADQKYHWLIPDNPHSNP